MVNFLVKSIQKGKKTALSCSMFNFSPEHQKSLLIIFIEGGGGS